MKGNPRSAANNAEQLQAEIAERYDELSDRLQRFARYVIDHPNEIAINTIATIAEHADVQPSVLIRFAKTFDYTGFSEMQKVFKQSLIERSPSYSERIKHFWVQKENSNQHSSTEVLREFASASRISLEYLETIAAEKLNQAVALLKQARIIQLIGQRRAFPVASYLLYALSHSNRPSHLLDGSGGMLKEQLNLISADDVMLAISFYPYAKETLTAVDQAVLNQTKVIAITDSLLSPIAQKAYLTLEVRDAEVRGFHSLTASLCLAQAIAVELAILQVQN